MSAHDALVSTFPPKWTLQLSNVYCLGQSATVVLAFGMMLRREERNESLAFVLNPRAANDAPQPTQMLLPHHRSRDIHDEQTFCKHSAQNLSALPAKNDERAEAGRVQVLHTLHVEQVGAVLIKAARLRLAAEEEVTKIPLSISYAR